MRLLCGFAERRTSSDSWGSSWLRRASRRACWYAAYTLLALPAAAEDAPASSAASTPAATQLPALPELPPIPSTRLPPPKPDDLAALDELLTRLTSDAADAREAAAQEILEAPPAWVPALAHRLNGLAEKSDKTAMKALLEKLRDNARDKIKREQQGRGEKVSVDTPDYLKLVLSAADPKSKAWQDLTRVVAISRLLKSIATVESVRVLLEIYVRFGEFLRVDTQLQLQSLGDKSVAALIEATRHPAEKIGKWAARQLDQMGKAIPGEVVQMADSAALADALRAYGRIRDIDSARILISFAKSERAQIRLAARQGVALLGETGAWQLRDAYQETVGKNPPRDWNWQRTARELFGQYDGLRLAVVQNDFKAALEAQEAGRLEDMRVAFDEVLARDPHFDGREQIASGYLSYAQRYAAEKPEAALESAKRAARLTELDTVKQAAKSLELTLEAERLLALSIADQTLLKRALELNPQNERAQRTLRKIETSGAYDADVRNRYAASAAIGVVALVAIVFIGARRRRPSATPAALAALSATAENRATAPSHGGDALENSQTTQANQQVPPEQHTSAPENHEAAPEHQAAPESAAAAHENLPAPTTPEPWPVEIAAAAPLMPLEDPESNVADSTSAESRADDTARSDDTAQADAAPRADEPAHVDDELGLPDEIEIADVSDDPDGDGRRNS